MQAIQLKDIVKDYPGVCALKGINLNVEKGSVHGFLGPNGAGKTTAMKIITGLIPPSSGEIEIDGHIGFLPEEPPLYNEMNVYEYIEFVQKINTTKIDIEKKSSLPSIDDIIELCGLSSMKKRLIANLSKGYRQRVGIASAICFNPEIIILDEPMVGLDPTAIQEIRNLILKLKEKHTIFISSHQLHEISLVCTHISIINKGEIVQNGKISDIQKSMQGSVSLEIHVENWNEEVEKSFKDKFKIEDFKSFKKESEFELNVQVSTSEDLRKSVSQFMVENDLGLLSLKQDHLNLEEIFSRTTKNS